MPGGTGQKFESATIAIAGFASVVATLLSMVSIWLQTKNYRKPLLQRYVVRILLMVPIYSISSWVSMVSLTASQFVDPIRDIYEAFTIYTFFQLLINYLSGERALIIMTHGREPVSHLWPMNHALPKVDISDPHTFLAIKRGILQYAWLKPILALATIIMKATGTYQEGYIGLNSGYFWSGLIYNVSVTVSLYSLGLFWVCMHHDLKPFRPVPKFLCIKLIIFASYWQGFMLSILVFLGAIPDNVQGYTPDNLAAAIQDFLICVEMPAFAVAHWYAFSWHDFADNRILAARLPVWYAFRDAFGVRDLIEDSKETFKGDKYGYRIFDSGDKIMAHEASRSRLARLKDGMRYERGGKGKYWIPRPDEINQTTPLLGGATNGGPSNRMSPTMTPHVNGFDEVALDPDEERLYDKARKLEFGDWNYPVITANDPSREVGFSPRPSYYQRHQYPSSSSSARSTPPLDRQPRDAVDPRILVDVKGKKKAQTKSKSKKQTSAADQQHSKGKDPLEIAYGPIVGTNPQITEDDFDVDTEGGLHKPQEYSNKQKGIHRPPLPEPEAEAEAEADRASPVHEEESRQWGEEEEAERSGGINYGGIADTEDLRDDDVWRR